MHSDSHSMATLLLVRDIQHQRQAERHQEKMGTTHLRGSINNLSKWMHKAKKNDSWWVRVSIFPPAHRPTGPPTHRPTDPPTYRLTISPSHRLTYPPIHYLITPSPHNLVTPSPHRPMVASMVAPQLDSPNHISLALKVHPACVAGAGTSCFSGFLYLAAQAPLVYTLTRKLAGYSPFLCKQLLKRS